MPDPELPSPFFFFFFVSPELESLELSLEPLDPEPLVPELELDDAEDEPEEA